MKIVDLDKLLHKFVKDYVAENKPDKKSDVDELLSDVYIKFEEHTFPELGGKTPVDYYDGYDGDYSELIKEHFKAGIAVSDYFLSSVARCAKESDLIKLIDNSFDEDVILPAIDALDKKGSKIAFNRYIDLLFDDKTDSCVVDKIAEILSDDADLVADKIIERLGDKDDADSVFISVLCNAKVKRDKIKKLLLDGFIMGEKIPEYCAYAITYGDESLLSDLEEIIDGETDYVSFKELNLAIEALGGEPRSDAAFAGDKDYIKLKTPEKETEDGDKDKN